MKYIIFFVIGMVLILWSPFGINPFVNQAGEKVFSKVASREVARPIAAVGYLESGVKIGFGISCIKEYSELYDLVSESSNYNSREWRDYFETKIKRVNLLCKVSREVIGL